MKEEEGIINSESNSTKEVYLELKYCERCGGLWLRERGSGQLYCVPCGEALEEMPPPTTKVDTAKLPSGPKCWREAENGDEEKFAGCAERVFDLEACGGMA